MSLQKAGDDLTIKDEIMSNKINYKNDNQIKSIDLSIKQESKLIKQRYIKKNDSK